MHFILPPHLTSASALPKETGNPEIVFSLKCCMLFDQKTRNTVKYHLIRVEPPFSVGAIEWVQTGPRKGSIASCCLLPRCSVLTKSVTLSVAV